MEILITNKQRLIKISHPRIKSLLKKALNLLISEGISGTKRKGLFHILSTRKSTIEISILFLNDKSMKKMNLAYRGKDKITDVISFPQFEFTIEEIPEAERQAPLFLGDIVINLHQAKRQAVQNNITLYNEVSRLLCHGLLHLLGFDHEKNAYQARKMASTEAKLLEMIKN